MIDARRGLLLLCVAGATILAGCQRIHRDPAPHTVPTPIVGQYKGRISGDHGKLRRFRLLLYAALPDRVHAEILSPLGTMQMILDGGQGRLAVTFVADGVSYVGAASPAAMERILGVPLTLEELVLGLLTGETGNDEIELSRTGAEQSLPENLEIRTASSSLDLRLQRLRPTHAASSELGTGTPPAGTEILPIGQLVSQDARWETALPGASGP